MNLPDLPYGAYLRHLGQIGPQSHRSGTTIGTWVCQVEQWRGPMRHITATGGSAEEAMTRALQMLSQPPGPKPKAKPTLSDLFL